MRVVSILSLVLCIISVVSASRLLCVCNGTIGVINPSDASIVLNQQASIELELIISSVSDAARNLYVLHGFIDDTNHGIQVFDGTTGSTLALVTLDQPVDSIYYDPSSSTYYALDFSGVFTINIKTGHMTMTYPFDPTFDVMYEESMAFDTKRHQLTLFNTTAIPDLLMTIDLVTKQSVAQVPISPLPSQQISPMLYAPSTSDFVLGWADHKFWRMNTTSGVISDVMDTIYLPFDTLSTAVEPNGRFLSFVGTDGKEHCFIVTIDMASVPWKVVYQPLTTPDLASLPTALAYMN